MANAPASAERLKVRDIELDVVRRGAGQPILALHGMQPIDPAARFLDLLAARAEIIAPSHPGFGDSPRPDGFRHGVRPRAPLSRPAGVAAATRRSRCSASRSAAGSPPRSPPPAATGSKGWSWSIRSASRSATARRRTFSTCSTRIPTTVRERMARSGALRARLQRVGGCRADPLRARLGRAVPVWLAALHVQPAAQALARRASRCRPWCCGARPTASSRPSTAAPMPG